MYQPRYLPRYLGLWYAHGHEWDLEAWRPGGSLCLSTLSPTKQSNTVATLVLVQYMSLRKTSNVSTYYVLFCPISRPHLVEYIFIQLEFNYSQKFTHYKYRIDSALYVMYFVCLYIQSFKSCFKLKITNGKGNRVSFFWLTVHLYGSW